MSKYISVTLLALALVVSVVWLSFDLLNKNTLDNTAQEPISKVIKYRLEVSNPKNTLLKAPSLIVAIPFDSAHQKVMGLTTSIPYKKIIDVVGNTSLDFDVSAIAPYETKIIDVTAKINIYPVIQKTNESSLEPYLRPERFIESDSEIITRKAQSFKTGSTKEIAEQTYDWVVSYLSDAGFIEEDRGALYALKQKKADCTGYMYLYGALLRANKIPARMVSGFIVETNKKLKIKDYHNWVEVYLDGAWRVVDPQNKKFLEDETNYIAMRIIDNTLNNKLFDNSQQLFKSELFIKVVMK